MFRIFSLLFLTSTAFDSNLLEKDNECGGSDDSKCALHALQRSAGTKDGLSRRERSKLRAYARQLQPGIVHVWKKLKILEIRSDYAADQVEVDLGVVTDDGKDDAPETANDDDEMKKEGMDLMEMESEEEDGEDGEDHHPHRSKFAKSQARIRATVKGHAYLQKELDLEWKMLQHISEKDKTTRKLLAAHGLVNLNARHYMNERPLEYEQCAGKGYEGRAECADEAICMKKSEWYSVCQPAQDILTSQGFKDPDAEAALLQRDQTMAHKFMNDIMNMHLQLEKLRQQVEDLNEDLGFIEQKVGRTTHEVMPCSGTGAAPKQCYKGRILLETIHVISNGSHVNLSAEGAHEISCNNAALSFSENTGTVKCQMSHFLNMSAAMQYCPDQQAMLLNVVLPKRKEKIKTLLKPTTCGANL